MTDQDNDYRCHKCGNGASAYAEVLVASLRQMQLWCLDCVRGKYVPHVPPTTPTEGAV